MYPDKPSQIFISKYELFKKIINIHGSIVECGFIWGGQMTFALLSAILEPINWQRKIIGFDTFRDLKTFPMLTKEQASQSI